MTPPVLLTVFNRPEHTRRALAAIRRAQPRVLLIVADGPRDADEVELCRETREVVEAVDWECDVRKEYSAVNLGCGLRVHTGIDWALSQFEDVIVLEDDCIPTVSFFPFCETLLEFYRRDERVMHIGSFNFQVTNPVTDYSYYFSKYPLASGAWATWRRAWRHYEPTLASWPASKKAGLVQSWCDDPHEQRYWTEIFDRMHEGATDVWDYQWNYTCWVRNGLAILPSVQLATNVGFGSDATHTKTEIASLVRPPGEIHRIEHPPFMIRNFEADAYVFENSFGGGAMRKVESGSAKVRRRLRQWLRPLRAARNIPRAARRQDRVTRK